MIEIKLQQILQHSALIDGDFEELRVVSENKIDLVQATILDMDRKPTYWGKIEEKGHCDMFYWVFEKDNFSKVGRSMEVNYLNHNLPIDYYIIKAISIFPSVVII